jgi:hypothetical protein
MSRRSPVVNARSSSTPTEEHGKKTNHHLSNINIVLGFIVSITAYALCIYSSNASDLYWGSARPHWHVCE